MPKKSENRYYKLILIQIASAILASFFVVGCNENKARRADTVNESCRGIYFETATNGTLEKFNQFYQADQAACLTEQIALSNWEKSFNSWTLHKLACKAQSQIKSQSLIASGNYYSYRDGRVFLDLNAATGIYRRIVYGEAEDGSPLFTKLQGCFNARLDAKNGLQLLLDTETVASSENFDPVEIFTATQSSSGLNLIRYDQSSDWTWAFCPFETSPIGYCDLLRNGSEMFLPTTLTAAQQSTLLDDAILIRKTYNYAAITSQNFDLIWREVANARTESTRDDFQFSVIQDVDTPLYTSDSWRNFVIGLVPKMPDTSSSTIPPICYSGSQSIKMTNGNSAKVSGEICYENGQYSLTQ